MAFNTSLKEKYLAKARQTGSHYSLQCMGNVQPTNELRNFNISALHQGSDNEPQRYKSSVVNSRTESNIEHFESQKLEMELKLAELQSEIDQQKLDILNLKEQLNQKDQSEAFIRSKFQQSYMELSVANNQKIQELQNDLRAKSQNENYFNKKIQELQIELESRDQEIATLRAQKTEAQTLEDCLKDVTFQNEKRKEEIEFVIENINAEKTDLLQKFQGFQVFINTLFEEYETEKNKLLQTLEQDIKDN